MLSCCQETCPAFIIAVGSKFGIVKFFFNSLNVVTYFQALVKKPVH